MIEIEQDLWTTHFYTDYPLDYNKVELCEICEITVLDRTYVYIINNLKEAGLLQSNYKKICCVCYTIKKLVGSNYHKGCGKPLIGYYSGYGLEVKCLECNKYIGRIFKLDGVKRLFYEELRVY